MPAVSQVGYTYIFCFFAYKNCSAGVVMPATRALLSKTFLAVFAFLIAKITTRRAVAMSNRLDIPVIIYLLVKIVTQGKLSQQLFFT